MEEERIPVFLVTGFLEAGKTGFLQFTMEQEYFRTEGKTLLIICEEGDTEYDEELLRETKTTAVCFGHKEELSPERLEELELLHNPERVLIEWNGMWDPGDLRLPADWFLHQQVTLIDASTFPLYAANMKPLLAAQVRNSELIICNRCDGVADLSGYRRTLKALNQKAEFVFEGSGGEMKQISEADLPYDLTREIIQIPPAAFGIWYMDCLDKAERYEGKTVEITGMVLKTPNFPKNYFVPGRMAMTCCEDDMTFLGFICKYRNARNLETKQWVRVRAAIAYEYWQDYGDKGPVLYADQVEIVEPIREIIQF